MNQAFAMVPHQAILNQNLSHVALRVLCLIALHRNSDNGWSWPSLRRMAIEIGYKCQSGEVNISRAVKELKEFGYIDYVPGSGRISSHYRVILDAKLPSEDEIKRCTSGVVAQTTPIELDLDPPSYFTNPAPSSQDNQTIKRNYKKEQEDSLLLDFEQFYKIYPRREGRQKALEAYRKARKTVDHKTIMDGLAKQRAVLLVKEIEYRPHPATWLNGKRWLDEVSPEQPAQNLATQAMKSWL